MSYLDPDTHENLGSPKPLPCQPSNNLPVTGIDLRQAIASILGDQPINPDQKPSIGCNIKWKHGNEPNF